MPNAYAFIAVCGTLVDRNTVSDYIDYVARHGELSANAKLYYLGHKALQKLGWLGDDSHKRQQLRLLRGIKKERLEIMSKDFYQEVCKPHLNYELIEELERLRQNDVELVLVSAGLDIYLAGLAKALNIRHLICSRLAWKGDRCIGALDGQECIGPQKVEMVRERFTPSPETLSRSYAYGSRVSDVPLLEWVGNPMAIWPDPGLQQIAKQRLWPLGLEPEIDTTVPYAFDAR